MLSIFKCRTGTNVTRSFFYNRKQLWTYRELYGFLENLRRVQALPLILSVLTFLFVLFILNYQNLELSP